MYRNRRTIILGASWLLATASCDDEISEGDIPVKASDAAKEGASAAEAGPPSDASTEAGATTDASDDTDDSSNLNSSIAAAAAE